MASMLAKIGVEHGIQTRPKDIPRKIEGNDSPLSSTNFKIFPTLKMDTSKANKNPKTSTIVPEIIRRTLEGTKDPNSAEKSPINVKVAENPDTNIRRFQNPFLLPVKETRKGISGNIHGVKKERSPCKKAVSIPTSTTTIGLTLISISFYSLSNS